MIGLEYICKLFDVRFKDLAEELKISKQTVNSWTSKRRPIPKKYLPNLSEKFNLPEKYFQMEINDTDKLMIQKIKLEYDLEFRGTLKDFEQITDFEHYSEAWMDKNRTKELFDVSIDILRNEIEKGMFEKLKFNDPVTEKWIIYQGLDCLKLISRVIQSANVDEIEMAIKLLSILVHYYEPSNNFELLFDEKDAIEYGDIKIGKFQINFNKTILNNIKDYFEKQEKMIQEKSVELKKNLENENDNE